MCLRGANVFLNILECKISVNFKTNIDFSETL
jgi:hypothetical protein